MSIIEDHVRRIDSQLDRLQLHNFSDHAPLPELEAGDASSTIHTTDLSERAEYLLSLTRILSTTSATSPLRSAWRIGKVLDDAGFAPAAVQQHAANEYESEAEWLLVGKATVQTYGILLNVLLEQTIPLSNDIWYWDDVLSSYTYTSLYTVQTSPLRLWDWTKDIYAESRRRLDRIRASPRDELSAQNIGDSLTAQWRQFYGLVQDSIRDRSVAQLQRRVVSPIVLCRTEARRKQASLKKLREMSASGLGLLMDEGLSFHSADLEDQIKTQGNDEWKDVVERSVALMDSVLQNVTRLESSVGEFEEACFALVVNDPQLATRSTNDNSRPFHISTRLSTILNVHLPAHATASQRLSAQYGRPSRLVRYWLPATAALLSGSTILRLISNRRAEILTWIRDLGTTARDFWLNWVIEPTKKIIGTIRHDKESEVAIMSKESLAGDRASLERMVVDFAIDNPDIAMGSSSPLTAIQIADIRAKVKEGDLTPVLRAYEKDLRSPFKGTVRGDLIRTLLIQVQKTKVDVEVAISGIDALLKSQELVFGFVGLTPGILVCIGLLRYFSGVFGSRAGTRRSRRSGQAIRVLRNVDRVLTMAVPTGEGMLSYKDHGLLLCEVHVLRSRTAGLIGGEVGREFLEDVQELSDIRTGVQRQLMVVQRIRWAYGKWLR